MANGHGGPRPGSGRPTAEFLLKAREIGDPLEILRLYWDVATGKDMEQVVTDAGVSIATPAQVKDRLRAGELFLDRLIGKVDQGVLLGGIDGDPLPDVHPALLAKCVELIESRLSGPPQEKSGDQA